MSASRTSWRMMRVKPSALPPIAAAALLEALVSAVVASARRIEGQRRCSPTAHVSIATVPRSFVSTTVPARRQLPLPPPVPELVVAATTAPCESGMRDCSACCCAAAFVFAVNAFAGEPALLAPPATQPMASAASS